MEQLEQTKLILNYKDSLNKIYDLKKSHTPLESNVEIDDCIGEVSKNFDFDFKGSNKFYPYEFSQFIKELDFDILCIVGASGSGKSVFSKNFGVDEEVKWDNNKAIVSHFDSYQEATEKLIAVGLNSIPTWCKPRNVLSVGEGYRADLARKLKDNCVIDEFTSVVDRNVAMSCSNAIQKYIRSKGLKRCVFVSCHKDFIDVLKPDYVIDLDDACIYDTRRLPKRKFELRIYETKAKREVWEIFRHHHYLSGDLNLASRVFVGFLNGQMVSFMAILPQPNGFLKNAFRIHRMVVLPDYQGLGIGSKMLKYFANLHVKQGCKFYIRTSHVKLHNYLAQNCDWEETNRSGQISPMQKGISFKATNRTPYSYKFIGKYQKELDYNGTNLYILKEEKEINHVEQISLF